MTKLNCLFWNIENFFDPKTGGPRKDYIPENGWTEEKFQGKMKRLGKYLKNLNNGAGPDIIGLAEMEYENRIEELVNKYLGKDKYKLFKNPEFGTQFFETDNIDTTIIYNSQKFEAISIKHFPVARRFPKGDICKAILKLKETGENIIFYVNHWTSRYQGEHRTEAFRICAAETIQQDMWKIYKKHVEKIFRDKVGKDINQFEKEEILQIISEDNTEPYFIVMGDLNDDPYSTSVREYLLATHEKTFVKNTIDTENIFLYNCSWEKLLSETPGTNYHESFRKASWYMFDQFCISRGLLTGQKVKYIENSFTVHTKGLADENGIPKRCQSWDRETEKMVIKDEYSDHYPVSIDLEVHS